SIHQRSLDWMNRGHDHASMINAIQRCRGRQFETCAHVILGVPGESYDDMMQTADAVADLGVDAIKLHNLYIVKDTPLHDQMLQHERETGEPLLMIQRDEYIRVVVDFLERMHPDVIVERISGEAPSGYLVAPEWCAKKSQLRNDIEALFRQRGTVQGSRHVARTIDATRPADSTPDSIKSKILDSRRTLPVLRF
ncbi:MAG: TIGR01212 family radical SAM protein, partial [Planctomycetota bacterium]